MRDLPPGYEFVDWTPDKVAAFWDFVALTQPDLYFAKQVGHQVVGLFRNEIDAAQRLVDFGCGAGYFMDALAVARTPFAGYDVSEGSLSQVRARFSDKPNFLGAFGPGSLDELAGTFDLAFCLEVVEHLGDEELDAAVADIHRLLRKGGRVVVTTPNEEDLSKSWVYCPDSRKVFHRWQHIRAWSAQTLSAAMRARGFEVERAFACNIVAVGSWPRMLAYRLGYALLGRQPANLVAVCRKI
jgi:SAM-dependent methyltransferase